MQKKINDKKRQSKFILIDEFPDSEALGYAPQPSPSRSLLERGSRKIGFFVYHQTRPDTWLPNTCGWAGAVIKRVMKHLGKIADAVQYRKTACKCQNAVLQTDGLTDGHSG